MWYVETLVHECQHYFELKNLYHIFTNGKCIKNEDVDVLKQISEYNAKRTGYFYYYKSVDFFNAYDESYLINDLKSIKEFYKKNMGVVKNISEFLYYQIRLLAIVSAWEDYFENDIAKDILLSEFFDEDVIEKFWQCLRVNIETADKDTLVKTIDNFIKIINCSKILSVSAKN